MDLTDPASFTPADSPMTLEDVITSPLYLDLLTPNLALGDGAIDFTLPRVDGTGTVTLSQYTGRQPVALIFGSYT